MHLRKDKSGEPVKSGRKPEDKSRPNVRDARHGALKINVLFGLHCAGETIGRDPPRHHSEVASDSILDEEEVV
jgi:hypothetical protein